MDGALAHFFWNFLKVEIIQIPFFYILEKNKIKIMIGKNFLDDALKIYEAPKLCTVMY